MKRDDVIETIKGFLSEEFDVNSDFITPEANLKETLDLDSLDYVDLVVIIEENFGIKVTGEDFVGVDNFNQFYDLIEKKLAAK